LWQQAIENKIMEATSEDKRMDTLRNELIVGEASPMIEDFDPQAFLQQIHERYL
jgi:hypothetical protein